MRRGAGRSQTPQPLQPVGAADSQLRNYLNCDNAEQQLVAATHSYWAAESNPVELQRREFETDLPWRFEPREPFRKSPPQGDRFERFEIAVGSPFPESRDC